MESGGAFFPIGPAGDLARAADDTQVLVPALGLAEHERHRGKLDEQRQRFIRNTLRQLIDELTAPLDKDFAAKVRQDLTPYISDINKILFNKTLEIQRVAGFDRPL